MLLLRLLRESLFEKLRVQWQSKHSYETICAAGVKGGGQADRWVSN